MSKKLPEYVTMKEFVKILDVITNSDDNHSIRDRLMVEVMFWAGLRVSEITKLDEENVRTDLEPPRIEIKNSKGGKNRDVPLNSEVLSRLRLYIKQTRQDKAKYMRDNPVFLSATGRRLTTRRVQQIVQKYAELSGIGKHIHPHTFRHGFASYMIEKNVDLRSIQELLGHNDIQTTQIYLNHLRSFDERHKAYLKIFNGDNDRQM